MKILIVDDSRFFRLANERALTKAGHQVVCAGDGEEGLRLAREHKPDLIVLDMMLPILSGPSVLKELRKDLQTVSIPVMVLTSLPKANEGKLLRDGATAYLEKSGLMLDKGSEVLVEEVQRMLSQAGAYPA
jgi:two-component system cell cycle response regulator DivK